MKKTLWKLKIYHLNWQYIQRYFALFNYSCCYLADIVKMKNDFVFFIFILQADLRKKMAEEEQKNHLSGEICAMQTEELAGNSQTLKEPGES